ncbi:MAG TPA: hypothetical protein VE130_04670 [Nitrososphaeraceae archaeon]|jgi:hypothetical protein|nr:hypothetical protein [Nitrososphaeraceae archaeon]
MNDFFSKTNRELFLYQLKWLGVFIGIGFIVIYLFEFPLDLIILIIAFIIINIYKTRVMLKKLGLLNDSNVKDFKSFIRSLFRSPSLSAYGNTPIRYYCMLCGNEHREIACPKCGSKMKRAE